MSDSADLSRLLQQAVQGDQDAANQLFVLVQDDLKAIARKRKRALAADDDLSTTGLVDEAFCRLMSKDAAVWQP